MQNNFLKSAALRSIEHHLNLEKLYVLGTNCGNYMFFSIAFDHVISNLTFFRTFDKYVILIEEIVLKLYSVHIGICLPDV